ncbi:MAG: pyrroline-5-carboxylate reductase [Clostridiales bacterium]|nr:pyrroline-5-carboxylate reductase [Clostridiales bacterium]
MAGFSYEFGFIGMGNMGLAMMKGLLGNYEPGKLTFSDKSRERMEDVAARTGVNFSSDNESCAKQSRCVILAVKPQQLDRVIEGLRDAVSEEQIVISIAPGVSVADLREKFGRPLRIVRAMPNTPALVGEGMTGVTFDPALFDEEETALIRGFFTSFGRVELVEEKLIDAVVCVSGSSPAYVYMFIEALADSAVKYGLPRAVACEMAAQAVLGSAKMVLETGKHPGELKDQVCSPGGTTIAGVAALEEYGLRNAVIKASDACYAKCSKIS